MSVVPTFDVLLEVCTMLIFHSRISRLIVGAMVILALGCCALRRQPCACTECSSPAPQLILPRPLLQSPYRDEVPRVFQPQLFPAAELSQAEQDHVYVWFINGMDFLGCGNFHGLAEVTRCSGFRNTKYGQVYDSGHFLTQICDIAKTDPDAKIVLVGFSAGAYCSCALAHDLHERQIPIALLVYMAADIVKDKHTSWPPNAARLLNVYGDTVLPMTGDLLRTENITGARNIRLATSHIAVPRHHVAIQALAEELRSVCLVPSEMPVPLPGVEPVPSPEELPAPTQPVMAPP